MLVEQEASISAQLFRKLLDSLEDDIETLGMEEVLSEGEYVPTQTECVAMVHVKRDLQGAAERLRAELKPLGGDQAMSRDVATVRITRSSEATRCKDP